MDILDLITNLKNHLAADASLSFVETIGKKFFTPETVPPFQTYCIIISPAARHDVSTTIFLDEKVYVFDIVCIVRNFDFHSNPTEESVYGYQSGFIGILKMIQLVDESLFNFVKEYQDHITVTTEERSLPVNFKNKEIPGMEGKFHIFPIPFQVRLQPIERRL